MKLVGAQAASDVAPAEADLSGVERSEPGAGAQVVDLARRQQWVVAIDAENVQRRAGRSRACRLEARRGLVIHELQFAIKIRRIVELIVRKDAAVEASVGTLQLLVGRRIVEVPRGQRPKS